MEWHGIELHVRLQFVGSGSNIEHMTHTQCWTMDHGRLFEPFTFTFTALLLLLSPLLPCKLPWPSVSGWAVRGQGLSGAGGSPWVACSKTMWQKLNKASTEKKKYSFFF